MDQTISCVATKNKAAYITFNPLNAVPVTLPDDAVFVIANCLRMSMKAETASKCWFRTYLSARLCECECVRTSQLQLCMNTCMWLEKTCSFVMITLDRHHVTDSLFPHSFQQEGC